MQSKQRQNLNPLNLFQDLRKIPLQLLFLRVLSLEKL